MRVAGTIFGSIMGGVAMIFVFGFLAVQGAMESLDIEIAQGDIDRVLIFGFAAAMLLVASGACCWEMPPLSLVCAAASALVFTLLGIEYSRMFFVFVAAAIVTTVFAMYATIDRMDTASTSVPERPVT